MIPETQEITKKHTQAKTTDKDKTNKPQDNKDNQDKTKGSHPAHTKSKQERSWITFPLLLQSGKRKMDRLPTSNIPTFPYPFQLESQCFRWLVYHHLLLTLQRNRLSSLLL